MSKTYDSFAAYLEDVYYDQIFSKVKSYVYTNRDRLDLSTFTVPDPSYVELSDFRIMSVTFHDVDTDIIAFNVAVQAEIDLSGRGRRDYESDSVERWFTIPFTGILKDGLHQVSIGKVSDYTKELFQAEDALAYLFAAFPRQETLHFLFFPVKRRKRQHILTTVVYYSVIQEI